MQVDLLIDGRQNLLDALGPASTAALRFMVADTPQKSPLFRSELLAGGGSRSVSTGGAVFAPAQHPVRLREVYDILPSSRSRRYGINMSEEIIISPSTRCSGATEFVDTWKRQFAHSQDTDPALLEVLSPQEEIKFREFVESGRRVELSAEYLQSLTLSACERFLAAKAGRRVRVWFVTAAGSTSVPPFGSSSSREGDGAEFFGGGRPAIEEITANGLVLVFDSAVERVSWCCGGDGSASAARICVCEKSGAVSVFRSCDEGSPFSLELHEDTHVFQSPIILVSTRIAATKVMTGVVVGWVRILRCSVTGIYYGEGID